MNGMPTLFTGSPGWTNPWSTLAPSTAPGAFGAPGIAGASNPFMRNEMALDVLQKQLQGPFTDEAQQSIINKGAGMTAAAENQQQEALRAAAAERGLSASDPSLQAEQRRLTAARQGANVNIAGDTRRAATTANYDGAYRAAQALRDGGGGGAFGMNSMRSQPRVSGYKGLDFKPIYGQGTPIFQQTIKKKV